MSSIVKLLQFHEKKPQCNNPLIIREGVPICNEFDCKWIEYCCPTLAELLEFKGELGSKDYIEHIVWNHNNKNSTAYGMEYKYWINSIK